MQVIDSNSVLDRDQFRSITISDEDLMREILGALIDDTSRQLQLLAAAIENKDAQGCARLAHYSKGACANVGANRLAKLMQELERNASAEAFGLCSQGLKELSAEIEILRNEAI